MSSDTRDVSEANFDSSRLPSPREIAIVLFNAIAANTFLREVPPTVFVSSSAWLWQMLIYLVRIPRRKGHSIKSIVLTGLGHLLAQASASTVRLELAQTGGISSCSQATRIEQPLTNLICRVSCTLPSKHLCVL